MNKYLKEFLHRGLIFSGLGPIVLGIVYFILSLSFENFSLSGKEVLLGILSTYILAFIQAGVSVFNQIEHWSVSKSTALHFSLLYIAYILSYLLNTWIPFEWLVIGIFTAVFVVSYFVIWLTVYLIVKKTSNEFNNRLKKA